MAFKPTNLLGLSKTLRAMANVPSRVSARFAVWVTEEMRRNYIKGVDPYGNSHAPLAASTIRKKGNDLVLRDSFDMMNSTRAVPLPGTGIALKVDPPYAIYSIAGTKNMPARAFFPAAGMPAKWRAELERIVKEEFAR